MEVHVSAAKELMGALMDVGQVIVCTAVPVANSTERPPMMTACELLYWSK